MKTKGYNGTVTFDGTMVTITRTGFAARILIGSGSKGIPIRHITGVQFVPARLGFRGFIQFTIAGGIEQRYTFGRRIQAAHHDENTVVFNRRQQGEFQQLRDAVQAAMAAPVGVV